KITDMENNQADYTIEEITWDIKNIEKEGYKHFMLKEIYEQPQVLKNAMRGRIKDDTIKLTLNLDDVFLKNLNRIIITACGTSWHAALIGKYLIEKHSKIPVEIDYASEFRYRDPIVTEKDLVIVISQSGETADTLSALREAKKKGAKTLGIVNVVGSTITREVDGGIYTHAGFEIGVASTKAFSTQIMALNLFNLLLTKLKNGKTNEFLTGELEKIPALVEKILDTEKIINIAEKYFNSTNFLYLGRGINFPTALEGALKLKEISYIHAEGYPAAEMKHGPIALIDKDMPVVFIANKGNAYKKIISNMEEVLSRKGRVIAIATEGDNEIADRIEDVIYVPDVIEELTPFLNVVPLQLLSYYIADLRSCEIDQPRNLAKSVTVE
ncbi:glutamine--fructose-6-phosphate transaminase (isomerizing), partial [bacterium]|nr:glutamine--fructose-6-phosphate transaminase (isomerizing) [bacterium]